MSASLRLLRRCAVLAGAASLGVLGAANCSLFSGLDELKGEADASSAGGSSGSGGGAGDGSAGLGGGSGDSGIACPPGKKGCGSVCVEQDDPNTGCADPSCDPCGTANAQAICVGGLCAVGMCANGFEDCNDDASDGCEADLKAGVTSCGGCGAVCSVPNAAVTCVAGACVAGQCDSGFADCDNDMSNGCETNIGADPANCGGCGNACPVPAGKSAVCDLGVCGVSNCQTPLADCDKDPSQSCETDLSTSTGNCGFCGGLCEYVNGVPACAGGQCVLSGCSGGYGNCDGNDANGCETATDSNVTHCGGCNNTCPGGASAAPVCSAGSCGINCDGGFANCDGNLANGCETNLNTSTSHCGQCNAACSTNHGTPSCGAGGCSIACAGGWGNCSGGVADGCETPLDTITNCGACGKAISVSGGTSQWNSIRYVVASGNTLQFWTCDYDNYCTWEYVTLNGFTASGATSQWNSIRYVQTSGNQLRFWTCDYDNYCNWEVVTLAGATATGGTSQWNTAKYVQTSGNLLRFWTCDYDNYCNWEEVTIHCGA